MDDLVGGTICNGCGHDRAYAPGIGYFCRNDACTYEKEQAKTMLRQMMPVDPRDARIQALETSLAEANAIQSVRIAELNAEVMALQRSLAEAEGRVIAEVVAWLNNASIWLNGGECCGQKCSDGVCCAPACIWGDELKLLHSVATALETGEWKK